MPAPATATAEEIRDVNTRYHDGAAADYDSKWGITFDELGTSMVLAKLEKALGGPLPKIGRSLELGAGTGYFTLNLLREGLIEEATCTDIAPGMLKALDANAASLGLDVNTVVCDAEDLPFDDDSFDLVLGHAVLHHIPNLGQAWKEIHRVLRPGGVAVFAGEPSERGDRIANVPKALAWRVSPLWRRALRATQASEGHQDGGAENHAMEAFVDVHAFTPGELASPAKAAGFSDVRVSGEELLANWFGWTNRALEASADPATVPMWWKQYAFHGYMNLQKVDRALLEGRLPASIFYNLMISARA
ncbi:MAG TPA: class I SAM-dependent methyltransferase [Baekduia sp.]|nr:class I SAM-dependent methyltransferase [Baekduia sp.]